MSSPKVAEPCLICKGESFGIAELGTHWPGLLGQTELKGTQTSGSEADLTSAIADYPCSLPGPSTPVFHLNSMSRIRGRALTCEPVRCVSLALLGSCHSFDALHGITPARLGTLPFSLASGFWSFPGPAFDIGSNCLAASLLCIPCRISYMFAFSTCPRV